MIHSEHPSSTLLRWLGLAAALFCCAAITGCGREKQTVTEIKRAFAMRAIAGEIEIGTSGRMAARDVDRSTLELLDVRFDIGGAREQDLLMHAERADIIIDTKANTMAIRFHNVTAAAMEGGITQEAVMVTSAWPLSVKAIAD
ncbi:MAG: hypothetical protein ACNA8P_00205 [Phycisphaerales bacterium]